MITIGFFIGTIPSAGRIRVPLCGGRHSTDDDCARHREYHPINRP
jgi:hypothetical protein